MRPPSDLVDGKIVEQRLTKEKERHVKVEYCLAIEDYYKVHRVAERTDTSVEAMLPNMNTYE